MALSENVPAEQCNDFPAIYIGKVWALRFVSASASEPVVDDNFYVIFNAHYEPLTFNLPGIEWGERWMKELDTQTGWIEEDVVYKAGDHIEVESRSLGVL